MDGYDRLIFRSMLIAVEFLFRQYQTVLSIHGCLVLSWKLQLYSVRLLFLKSTQYTERSCVMYFIVKCACLHLHSNCFSTRWRENGSFFGRTFCICTTAIIFACSWSISHFRWLSFGTSKTCKFNGSQSAATKKQKRFPGLKNGLDRILYTLFPFERKKNEI